MHAQSAHLNRPSTEKLVLSPERPVHFIGVGGIGMSALAKVLLQSGFTVSGSDARENDYLAMLRDLGATVFIGHDAGHVPQNAIVVASSAIDAGNPEAQEAQSRGLTIFHRSDVLRELLHRHEISIGLTGTHGKTSMTGMTGLVLEQGGLDPTIIAGGKIPGLGTNAKGGKDLRYAVAELDESDGTVVQYHPAISVIANLELDHPDHYRDGLNDLKETFCTYLDGLNREHTVLFNLDCPTTRALYAQYRHRVNALAVYPDEPPMPESREPEAYWVGNLTLHAEGGYQADVFEGDLQIGSLWLQVPGRHNVANALFAAIIGYRLGVPFDSIRRTLENFTGMGRRFEILGKVNGARIVDDYAHHPTEVSATLRAAQEFNQGKGRVIAMFQPHRYSRLQAFWDDFAAAFADADEVILLDVYGAGETPMPNVSAQALAEAMDHPAVEYWPTMDSELIEARLRAMLTPDDLLLTMGAGDITRIGRHLVNPA